MKTLIILPSLLIAVALVGVQAANAIIQLVPRRYIVGCGPGTDNETCSTALNTQQNVSTPSQQTSTFGGRDFGDFSDLRNIPIVGGIIASHSIATGVLHNEQGVFIPWKL